ncbi:hypothetical protein FOXYSP1_14254 [Fusarium oxysporum f. sp. phaseoli]
MQTRLYHFPSLSVIRQPVSVLKGIAPGSTLTAREHFRNFYLLISGRHSRIPMARPKGA